MIPNSADMYASCGCWAMFPRGSAIPEWNRCAEHQAEYERRIAAASPKADAAALVDVLRATATERPEVRGLLTDAARTIEGLL